MPNHLINESSPYLLQHKDQPVDWYPWGDAAFEKARREKKPIFLSIGYSTCHWCHVMAHESFEDPETAKVLNRDYVCIKVDREERPDVDSIYMQACQILNRGNGGWPLTILMTADQEPFWAGTYLPKEYLMKLLAAAADQWKKAPQNLLRTALQMTDYLQAEAQAPLMAQTEEDLTLVRQAADHYLQNYDPVWGGFSQAPKFPISHVLLFLLKYAAWDKKASQSHAPAGLDQAIIHTLDQMSQGGIYDQLGGGFCRYATDQRWLVPHFEKMLCDNALLAMAYAKSYALFGIKDHARICRETLHYILSEMRSPDGTFYTSQDADTQGIEGLYYTFTKTELDELLPEDQAALFCSYYGITQKGNFQGRNILSRTSSAGQTSQSVILPTELRKKVYDYRRARMHLGRDDKILVSWNGLMIWSLARCAGLLSSRAAVNTTAESHISEIDGAERVHDRVVFEEGKEGGPEMLGAAETAASWILDHLADEQMHLRTGYLGGRTAAPGKLDDYVFLIKGLLELYRAGLSLRWLEAVVRLSDVLLAEFFDENNGGFYAYGIHDEKLLVRKKEAFDGGTPTGNSLACGILYDLFHYTGQIRFQKAWKKQIAYMKSAAGRYPAGSCLTMAALIRSQEPAREILCASAESMSAPEALSGLQEAMPNLREAMPGLPDALPGLPASDSDYILVKTRENADLLSGIAPFTREIPIPEEGILYYRCQGGSCSLPVRNPADL